MTVSADARYRNADRTSVWRHRAFVRMPSSVMIGIPAVFGRAYTPKIARNLLALADNWTVPCVVLFAMPAPG